MTVDLSTTYLGLELANPIVASSSPLTGTVEGLLDLQNVGVGAVVLPSVFEEQIEHESMAVHHGLEFGAEHFAEAAEGYFPELDTYNTGPGWYLNQVTAATDALSIPVIVSGGVASEGAPMTPSASRTSRTTDSSTTARSPSSSGSATTSRQRSAPECPDRSTTSSRAGAISVAGSTRPSISSSTAALYAQARTASAEGSRRGSATKLPGGSSRSYTLSRRNLI